MFDPSPKSQLTATPSCFVICISTWSNAPWSIMWLAHISDISISKTVKQRMLFFIYYFGLLVWGIIFVFIYSLQKGLSNASIKSVIQVEGTHEQTNKAVNCNFWRHYLLSTIFSRLYKDSWHLYLINNGTTVSKNNVHLMTPRRSTNIISK